MIVGVLIAEALLLTLGFVLQEPLLGAAAAGALAFLLLAYRRTEFAWVLVWVAFPFSVELRISAGAMYVPTEPMIVLALAGWALRGLDARNLALPPSRLHLPLAVTGLIALLSVILSPFQSLGIKAWVAGAGYAAFGYLYFFLAPHGGERLKRWMPVMVASAAFWGLYGTIRVLLEGLSLGNAYHIAYPFFYEHGTYAAYLAIFLPLAFLLTYERRGRARWWYAAATLAITLGIVCSFTRATWVSLALVMPLAVFLWTWKRRSPRALVLFAAFACLVFGLVLVTGAGQRLARHAGSVTEKENVSNLERINRWMAAIEMARDRPVLGVGYGAYAAAYPQYRHKLVVTELAFEYMGPHSEVLRLLAETGVLGLLSALWFLGAVAGAGWKVFLRTGDPDARLLAMGLLAGLGTYAVHGIFNSYIGIDKITIPFWVGIGMLAALARNEDHARDGGVPPSASSA